ncbi:hypothetical protein [Sphingobacterium sp. UME9]|uniref:hypothetical protein n=1 Tax=Sphingobacterium sp. UME9 TaxID=1862316 RepID=UPI0015FFE19E|nr:hypothetical protein [Sphingobacterium sp. UME9]MBB1646561.1 hypothetical protein [Sphingobacterium sp. UME9]
MVNIELIKEHYLQLLTLLQQEIPLNQSAQAFLDYVLLYKNKFSSAENADNVQQLREFLRGANRFADEFSFSDQNGSQIQFSLKSLYDLLNTAI